MASFHVTDIDKDLWDTLFDTALVALVAHKLEKLLQEILGDVLIWCPAIAQNKLKNKLKKEMKDKDKLTKDLVDFLRKEDNRDNDVEKRKRIAAWMSELNMPLGDQIETLDEFKKVQVQKVKETPATDASQDLKFTFFKGKVFFKDKADKWFEYLKTAKEKIYKLTEHLLTVSVLSPELKKQLKGVGLLPKGALPEIKDKRNNFIHHGHCDPKCLQLKDDVERKKLKDLYKAVINSGILEIIDASESKKEEYLKVVKVSDWKAILGNYESLEKDLQKERDALAKESKERKHIEADIVGLREEIEQTKLLYHDALNWLEDAERLVDELKKENQNLKEQYEEVQLQYAETASTVAELQVNFTTLKTENLKLEGVITGYKAALRRKDYNYDPENEVVPKVSKRSQSRSRNSAGESSSVRPGQTVVMPSRIQALSKQPIPDETTHSTEGLSSGEAVAEQAVGGNESS